MGYNNGFWNTNAERKCPGLRDFMPPGPVKVLDARTMKLKRIERPEPFQEKFNPVVMRKGR